jgi:hypothetical protein
MRSWDGQVKKWRRLLHAYDPDGVTEHAKADEAQAEMSTTAGDDQDAETDGEGEEDSALSSGGQPPATVMSVPARVDASAPMAAGGDAE